MFDDLNLLTLNTESPCIDIGTAYYTCHHGHKHNCPCYDIDGIPRPSKHVTDLGAQEFIKDRLLMDVPEVNQSTWYQVYPNPVTQMATFKYELEVSGQQSGFSGKPLVVR